MFSMLYVCYMYIVKLQLNSQLHLHYNPTPSPIQVNSTPPRVELEIYLIFSLPPTHPPTTTSPYYFSELQNQVNKHLSLKLKGREQTTSWWGS